MSVATEERSKVRGAGRPRVSLRVLAIWVLGAGVYFSMVRWASGFWFEAVSKMRYLDVYRVIGVVLLAPAVLLATLLVGDLSRRLRDRRASGFATAWRVGAVAVLVGLGGIASASYADDRSAILFSIFERASWKVQISSIALTIGLFGVLLGLIPPRAPRAGRRAVGRRRIAPGLAVAGLAGVLIMAFWPWASIPYLVLMAVDAVDLAKYRPAMMHDAYILGHRPDPTLVDPGLWRPLTERLATVGIASALALLVCGLALHRLGLDLRRPASVRRSWPGAAYRLALVGATWGAAAYLLFRGVATVHPDVAAGFRDLLHPLWSAVVAVSFLALSAGLAARGLAGPAEPPVENTTLSRPRWLIWATRVAIVVAKLGVCVFLAMVIASAVWQVRGGLETFPWFVPLPLSVLVGGLAAPLTFATKSAVYFDPTATPEALPLVFGSIGLAVVLVRYLLSRGDPGRLAPIDRIGDDRRLIGRFLVAWLTISGAIFAAMPAFALAGFAVLHFTLKMVYP